MGASSDAFADALSRSCSAATYPRYLRPYQGCPPWKQYSHVTAPPMCFGCSADFAPLSEPPHVMSRVAWASHLRPRKRRSRPARPHGLVGCGAAAHSPQKTLWLKLASRLSLRQQRLHRHVQNPYFRPGQQVQFIPENQFGDPSLARALYRVQFGGERRSCPGCCRSGRRL